MLWVHNNKINKKSVKPSQQQWWLSDERCAGGTAQSHDPDPQGFASSKWEIFHSNWVYSNLLTEKGIKRIWIYSMWISVPIKELNLDCQDSRKEL